MPVYVSTIPGFWLSRDTVPPILEPLRKAGKLQRVGAIHTNDTNRYASTLGQTPDGLQHFDPVDVVAWRAMADYAVLTGIKKVWIETEGGHNYNPFPLSSVTSMRWAGDLILAPSQAWPQPTVNGTNGPPIVRTGLDEAKARMARAKLAAQTMKARQSSLLVGLEMAAPFIPAANWTSLSAGEQAAIASAWAYERDLFAGVIDFGVQVLYPTTPMAEWGAYVDWWSTAVRQYYPTLPQHLLFTNNYYGPGGGHVTPEYMTYAANKARRLGWSFEVWAMADLDTNPNVPQWTADDLAAWQVVERVCRCLR